MFFAYLICLKNNEGFRSYSSTLEPKVKRKSNSLLFGVDLYNSIMTFKFPRFVLLVFVLALSANVVFAEGDPAIVGGDVNCSGKIMGKTKISNANFGYIDFDSHPSPYSDANKVTDLSIVGLGQGLAPADRNLAACLDAKNSVAVPLIADEYVVKGYAWNTNLGFFSFFCDGGKNQGVDCGAFNYGVKVGVADGAGKRLLSGNAWNPSFGYIQFAGGGGIPYQVSADKDGKLSGYGWTEAKVWVDMAGVTMQIPGKQAVKPVVIGPCSGKPFACLEVTDPDKGLDKVLSGGNSSGGIKIGSDPDIKVANGVDEYQVSLYLMEADGVTPMDKTKYDIGQITFSWSDTVKIKQDVGSSVGTSLDKVESPWSQGTGGIIYKPITVSLSDFTETPGGSGHYILNKTIKSYAPTTDMNVSYTSSFKPNSAFKNEVFFNSMKDFGNKIPVVKESNRLKLSKMDLPITVKATGQAPVTADGKVYSNISYPNGKDGLFFQFRPAVEVSNLFSPGNASDSITGFRSIPFSFKVGGKKDSKLAASASVDLKLDYDKTMTDDTCAANGEDIVGGGFTVSFVQGGNSYTWQNVGNALYSFDLQAVATLPDYDSLSDADKAAIAKPCMQAMGPSLYSIVKYTVDGKNVSYYSNKLPRIISAVSNPVAVIYGNLYAAKAFSPSASVETQETGSKSVNIVRDGIYENITSKIPGVVLEKDPIAAVKNTKNCTIVDNGLSGCSGPPVSVTNVDGTNVSVYKNTDVHINLSSSSAYTDNQTVVVMNGNIYIDSDIYKSAPSTDKVQIIALRPYSAGCNKGNIYVKNKVKNINANVFSDCSVFSYVDEDKIDPNTGLYKWTDFSEMIDSLSYQLRWFGSIASHNTVGGSDLDKDLKNPLSYLLDGFKAWPTNGLTSDQKLAIQSYDLNYLRLFKLSIQTNELGMPIDQSCKKGLSLEEMLKIKDYSLGQSDDTVYGDDGVTECDGIDALSPYDAASNSGGDLVAPVDATTLAQGLKDGEYDPIYVIFSASTSPLFKK